MMKRVLTLLAAAIPVFAQQSFDFKLLDKIGAKATESTNITLEGDTLKLAEMFLGNDEESLKPLVKNLKGIYVRSFEFAKPGQFDPSDLAALRTYLKSPPWTKIVDVKEPEETSEVYLQPLPNSQLGGLAIISVEPQELTVVLVAGVLNQSDIAKLSGNLGIPEIPSLTVTHGGKKTEKSKKDSKENQ